jgi:hypothetical protein
VAVDSPTALSSANAEAIEAWNGIRAQASTWLVAATNP